MKRLRRKKEFELSLQLNDADFLDAPRDSHRNWLVNRAMDEWCRDLYSLNEVSRVMVPGGEPMGMEDRTQSALSDDEIMEDWQIPLMEAMANIVGAKGGDILEIGFGRGVSADLVQGHRPKSHTVVECNDSVVERFHRWREKYPERDIRLLHGRWQDLTDQFERYDGVLFHTYPLNEEERFEHASRSVTFAAHFFATAAQVLNGGGVFTYLSNEIDSLSRAHQRALLEHFEGITIQLVSLELPPDVRDAWWSPSMVTVRATKA